MAKAKQNEWLKAMEELLGKIETDIKRAKLMIHQLAENKDIDMSAINIDMEKVADNFSSYTQDDMQVVEWVFDGYFMVGSDKKKYPVPLNYSSKSKLIPGDVLKLRIMTDGKLIYKLIGQANRQFIKATLSKSDDNKFIALTDEWTIYYLNQAAVSYFKWKTWDELSIIVNSDGVGNFAAIEAMIPQGAGLQMS